ncbi:hypothetical protein [Sanguibacter sp. 25GB23B1]|uniref:hypothetical protein n=1 Tax=unclassified Sanguibacter TaxID=2645534 RepID=UPI0032AEDF7A
MPPTTPRTTARDPRLDRWAAALLTLPFVSIVVCIALRRENVADAVLPAADGRIPLELVGALWLVLPAIVAVLLLMTVRGDDVPPRWARGLALLVAAWIGTVSFFPTPTTGYDYVDAFGAAAPRAEAVAGGLLAGMVGIVCAVILTGVVLCVAYRRPADWEDWSPEARDARNRSAQLRLGLVLISLLVLVLVLVTATMT